MALYQKYRPNSFDNFIGNSDTIEALRNLLSKKERPHVYLFSGPTGCGKTTLARIVSQLVGAGSTDITEIDTADFRGIDTIRELRKQSQYKPMNGDSRAWILDECHKLSNDAQNALLKLLEDTPEHVYFFLCTTDPHKLLPTIVGRCSIHEVKKLGDSEMIGLLRRIAKKEGEKVDIPVLEQIALDSQGHPRNAINTLEKVLAVEPDKRMQIAKKTAEEQSQSIALCRALIRGAKWKEVCEILKGLKEEDPEGVRRHVLAYASSVLLGGDNQTAAVVLECFIEPFYNSGFSGLVYACYSVVNS